MKITFFIQIFSSGCLLPWRNMGKILCNVHEGVLFVRIFPDHLWCLFMLITWFWSESTSTYLLQVFRFAPVVIIWYEYMHLIASVFNLQPVMSIYTGCPSTVNSKGINIMTVMLSYCNVGEYWTSWKWRQSQCPAGKLLSMCPLNKLFVHLIYFC